MCKNTSKVTRSFIVLTLVMSMLLSLFGGFTLAPTMAAAEISSVEETVMGNSTFTYRTQKQKDDLHKEVKALPSKFDLRNVDGKNYVTPVKLQNPWGSCWSFAATAAAETSLLYEYGVEAKGDNAIDLSEKALAWYSFQRINEKTVCDNVPASQIGEGIEVISNDINAAYNMGGVPFFATSLYASGAGPKYEEYMFKGEDDEHPYAYRGKNAWTDFDMFTNPSLKDVVKQYYVSKKGTEEGFEEYYNKNQEAQQKKHPDGNNTGSAYSMIDDWSLPTDGSHWFNYNVEILQESRILPSPAKKVSEGLTEKYIGFDQAGVDAIKKEITEGRPVSIGYKADMSMPGQEPDEKEESYMNTETWSQYTCDDYTLDHAVCIIGYDDNYSKENFLKGNSKTGESKTPPADGAFIVKNSWGSVDDQSEGRHNSGNWGINGTGYFYLSYYDKTIDIPESFNFYTTKDEDVLSSGTDYIVNQYDFMPQSTVTSVIQEDACSMANVFTAEKDQKLIHISTQTATPETTVHYAIYKLNENCSAPDDGEMLESGAVTFETGGYHNIALKGSYPLKKGTKFSVICTQMVSTENGISFEALYGLNVADRPGMDGAQAKIYGIINPGESFNFKDGKWVDWSEESKAIIDDTKEVFGIDVVSDNLGIKAYSVPATAEDFVKDISPAKVVLSKTSVNYNGKVQKPSVKSVTLNGKNLPIKAYSVSILNAKGTNETSSKNAGTYIVSVAGNADEGYKGSATVKFKINQVTNTIKLNNKVIKKAVTYKVKKKAVNKKAVTYKVSRNGSGKITMTNKSSAKLKKYLKLKGTKVTLSKKAPKGTYKFTLTVATNTNWKKTTTKVITVKVR